MREAKAIAHRRDKQQACIREVPGSNIGRTRNCRGFLQPIQSNIGKEVGVGILEG